MIKPLVGLQLVRNGIILNSPDEVVHSLMVTWGFQDVSFGNCAVRVLRHDVFGITIYYNTGNGYDRDLWCVPARYVIVYESEISPEDQLRQVIAETNESTGIWRILQLISAHAERIVREIEVLLDTHGIRPDQSSVMNFIESLDLSDVGDFDENIRKSIIRSLKGLSCHVPGDDSYAGFVNAAFSKVDDWLMTQASAARHGARSEGA